MEFCEKLQQLRKQKEWTQEQLAQQLYVSRTAISKWESGKGYPSIDSLKAIAQLFAVSVDELLCCNELVALAQDENRRTRQKLFGLAQGFLDVSVLLLPFLPLFAQQEGERFISVSLFYLQDYDLWIKITFWALFFLTGVLGVAELVLQYREHAKGLSRIARISLLINAGSVLFLIASRQLYAAALLFVLVMAKALFVIKSARVT